MSSTNSQDQTFEDSHPNNDNVNSNHVNGQMTPEESSEDEKENNQTSASNVEPTASLEEVKPVTDTVNEVKTEVENVNESKDQTDIGQSATKDSDSPKLFLGQIPPSCTEHQLRELFEPFGKLHELALFRNRQNPDRSGYGFITYMSKSSADAAIEALHTKVTLPGAPYPIQLKYADGESERVGDAKLFIGNLPLDATDSEIYDLFKDFGPIKEVLALRNSDGTTRGSGFVRFVSIENAKTAIEKTNGVASLRNRVLVVSFAESSKDKNKRKRDDFRSGPDRFDRAPQHPHSQYPIHHSSSYERYDRPSSYSTPYSRPNSSSSSNRYDASSNRYDFSSNRYDSSSIASYQSLYPTSNSSIYQNYPSNNSGRLSSVIQGIESKIAASIQPQQTSSSYNYPSSANQNDYYSQQQSNQQSTQPYLDQYSSYSSSAPSSNANAASAYSQSIAAYPQSQQPYSAYPSQTYPPITSSYPSSAAGIYQNQPYQQNQMWPQTNVAPNSSNDILAMMRPSQPTAQTTTSHAYDPNMASALGSKQEGPPDSNLFVVHLPKSWQNVDLYQAFVPFGQIISANIFTDKDTGESRCFGFVSYDNPTSAMSAITAMNGFCPPGSKHRIKVEVKRR